MPPPPPVSMRMGMTRRPPSVMPDAQLGRPAAAPLADVGEVDVAEKDGRLDREVEGVEAQGPAGPGVAVHDRRPVDVEPDALGPADVPGQDLPAGLGLLVDVRERPRLHPVLPAAPRPPARDVGRADVVEERAAAADGEIEHVPQAVDVRRLDLGPLALGEGRARGAVDDLVERRRPDAPSIIAAAQPGSRMSPSTTSIAAAVRLVEPEPGGQAGRSAPGRRGPSRSGPGPRRGNPPGPGRWRCGCPGSRSRP